MADTHDGLLANCPECATLVRKQLRETSTPPPAPEEEDDAQPEDDAVWGLLAEMGVPINIHVALTQAMPRARPGFGE